MSWLQIGLIEAGLLIPQGEPVEGDLVIARQTYRFCSSCAVLIPM